MTPDDVKHRTEKQLWAAVILQALEDATAAKTSANAYDRRTARDWFNKAGPDFREVCSLAGMDHDAVRSAALQKFKEFDEHGKKRGRVVTYQGERLTLAELSERTGINVDTIRGRFARGVRGDALVMPFRQVETLTFNGETRTVPQWSKITGVSESTIKRRIKDGLSAEEALTPGRTKPTKGHGLIFGAPDRRVGKPCKVSLKQRYDFAGQSKTLSQWAIDRDMNFHTLRTRIANGWTIERALTTPIQKKRSKTTKRLAA